MRSWRVAQCSQSFPQQLDTSGLLGREAFVGGRREATELAKVGPRGADADGDHVGVGDDRSTVISRSGNCALSHATTSRACEGP